MYCQLCGTPMRLITGARPRLLLYWCSACQRFTEISNTHRGRHPADPLVKP